MSGYGNSSKSFNVFLCHHSEDKPEIRQIAKDLEGLGIRPWLDEREIRPGTSWQQAVGEQIENIESAAVFVGKSGIGPWQNREILALLHQFVNRKCPVIPVVLPSAEVSLELPWTLQNLHFVDFRRNIPDPLLQLVWGVTGQKPQEVADMSLPGTSAEERDLSLLPRKEKQVIEIRLPGNLDSFSAGEQAKVLHALSALLEISDVRLTRAPLAGSIRLYLELSPEDADKVYAAAKLGQLSALGIVEARLYPAIAAPPGEEQRTQLTILRNRVYEQWVGGVLKNSLYHDLLLSLGKRPVDEAVEPPWKHTIELAGQRRPLHPQNSKISEVFDATGLLLILGEPGSGKTTTLLELASNLIARVDVDRKERVPVVLNLSGWKKRQPLDEWVVEELNEKYHIPAEIAHSWLVSDYLVLLLDGLDEVQTTLQPECVSAINEFIEEFKPSGLVVCCRLMEYQWLPHRLKLNGAICLEPLSLEEVDELLANGGQQLALLRRAVHRDPVLQELARTPLMLSIMSLAYQDLDADDSNLAKSEPTSSKERRDHILGLYVEQIFQRKEIAGGLFPKDRVVNWLSWLARAMGEHSQSVFMLERLQPSCLGSKVLRVSYGVLAAMIVGLISGLVVSLSVGVSFGLGVGVIGGLSIVLGCWTASPLQNGVVSGLIFSVIGPIGLMAMIGLNAHLSDRFVDDASLLLILLIGGLMFGLIAGVGVDSLRYIEPVEAMNWNWMRFWKKAGSAGLTGVLIGWPCGLLVGVGSSALGHVHFPYVMGIFLNDELEVVGIILGSGLGGALIGGLIGALIGGLIGGLNGGLRMKKSLPNEGIKSSFTNSVVAACVGFLMFGLIGGLVGWLVGGLFDGLALGLSGGLALGLNRGGSAVIKHYSLRFILGIKRYAPFRFIEFLDYCAELTILKKGGGGYIFVHRMLLEYFAELSSGSVNGAKKPAGKVSQ